MTNDDAIRWVPKTAFVMPIIPEELGIDPLVLALLHAHAFLELSEDDAVDPDWAVEAEEHIAMYLSRLPPRRSASLRRDLAKLADWGSSQQWPDDVVTFFRDFWSNACGGDDE